jgi:hypothetical protein
MRPPTMTTTGPPRRSRKPAAGAPDPDAISSSDPRTTRSCKPFYANRGARSSYPVDCDTKTRSRSAMRPYAPARRLQPVPQALWRVRQQGAPRRQASHLRTPEKRRHAVPMWPLGDRHGHWQRGPALHCDPRGTEDGVQPDRQAVGQDQGGSGRSKREADRRARPSVQDDHSGQRHRVPWLQGCRARGRCEVPLRHPASLLGAGHQRKHQWTA